MTYYGLQFMEKEVLLISSKCLLFPLQLTQIPWSYFRGLELKIVKHLAERIVFEEKKPFVTEVDKVVVY